MSEPKSIPSGPSQQYLKMLRGELTPGQYVAAVRTRVAPSPKVSKRSYAAKVEKRSRKVAA